MEFEQLLPQRPPFLFVDRVIELSTEQVVAEHDVLAEAPYLAGHFPGRPTMPGVLMAEFAFQAGAILLGHRMREQDETLGERLPVLTRITDARFKRMVTPGQTLQVAVTVDDSAGEASYLTGRVTVDGALVLRVTFACMLAEGS